MGIISEDWSGSSECLASNLTISVFVTSTSTVWVKASGRDSDLSLRGLGLSKLCDDQFDVHGFSMSRGVSRAGVVV